MDTVTTGTMILSGEGPAREAEGGARSDAASHLQGHMGVGELLSTVLAFSAPVSVVSGFIPIIIGFEGTSAPIMFLVAMVLLLLFAMGFTAMGRHIKDAGAFYAYVTVGLGRAMGLGAAFLALWGYLLLGFCCFPFFALNVAAILGGHSPHISWGWFALVCWAASGILSYFRIDLSAKVLSIAMILEVAIVGALDLSVGLSADTHILVPRLAADVLSSPRTGISVLFAVVCFIGFEATAIFRSEVVDPQKTIPRATYLAVGLIGLFYAIAAWALVTGGGNAFAQDVALRGPAEMFPHMVHHYLGSSVVYLAQLLLTSSLFAAVLSGQNILARYLYKLSLAGVLPAPLSRVHAVHGSPYLASGIVSLVWFLMGLFFCVIGADPVHLYGSVAGVGGLALLSLLLLTSLSVIVFFLRNSPGWGGWWQSFMAPALSTAGMAVIFYYALVDFAMLTGGSEAEGLALKVATFGIFVLGFLLAVVRGPRDTDIAVDADPALL